MLAPILPRLVFFNSGERPSQLEVRGGQRVLVPPAAPLAPRSRTRSQLLRSSQFLCA